MKRLLLAGLLVAGSAAADTDFSVTWDGRAIPLVQTIAIDLEIGKSFWQANGAIDYLNGYSVPITGTCFGTENGGAYCVLNMPQGLSGHAMVNPFDLSLIWETQDVLGNYTDQTVLPIVGVE